MITEEGDMMVLNKYVRLIGHSLSVHDVIKFRIIAY